MLTILGLEPRLGVFIHASRRQLWRPDKYSRSVASVESVVPKERGFWHRADHYREAGFGEVSNILAPLAPREEGENGMGKSCLRPEGVHYVAVPEAKIWERVGLRCIRKSCNGPSTIGGRGERSKVVATSGIEKTH
jgi:hypothetical protein